MFNFINKKEKGWRLKEELDLSELSNPYEWEKKGEVDDGYLILYWFDWDFQRENDFYFSLSISGFKSKNLVKINILVEKEIFFLEQESKKEQDSNWWPIYQTEGKKNNKVVQFN